MPPNGHILTADDGRRGAATTNSLPKHKPANEIHDLRVTQALIADALASLRSLIPERKPIPTIPTGIVGIQPSEFVSLSKPITKDTARMLVDLCRAQDLNAERLRIIRMKPAPRAQEVPKNKPKRKPASAQRQGFGLWDGPPEQQPPAPTVAPVDTPQSKPGS